MSKSKEVLNIGSESTDIPEGCNTEENPYIGTIDTSQITIDEVKRAVIKLKDEKSRLWITSTPGY